MSPEQARDMLWRAGILRWKLHPAQQELYDSFYSCPERRFILNCSRRWGKTHILITLAIEHALRIPSADVKYVAPTQKQIKRFFFKLFNKILADCPADIKPEWFSQENVFEFRNGSTISIGAMDSGRSDSLRGTDCHFGVVDEAGFSPSNYVEDMVESVLHPMTMLTKGKIVVASTPPPTPRHAFEEYFKAAQLKGAAVHKTIWDNSMLTKAEIEEEIARMGGPESTRCRRELFGEFVVDESLIVLPEFTNELQKEICIEVERPSHFDAYTGMDVGMKDATGVVFGYWDFRNARIVVEDEALMHGVKEVRTDLIAELIKSKEKVLWNGKAPYFRVSDTELLLINDLDRIHGLRFVPAQKDNKQAAINELRIFLQNKQIVINPRCKNLIGQLESCIWDAKREKFDRVAGFFHFDLVDALIYLVRSVRQNKNPFPADRYSESDKFFYSQPSTKSPTAKVFEQVFKVKRFGA